MATKMFSPKIEIISYFDELINQVDIDIEESLEKYNENQVLGDLECFKIRNRRQNVFFTIAYITKFKSSTTEDKQQTMELWSESTKVVDYLNQVRMRTIDELKKAQTENLEYYELNSERLKSLEEMSDGNKIEELKSKLFAERFYFQVRIKRENKPWVFNLFTFVTDFYMSPSDIHILEVLINSDYPELSKFFDKSKPLFDEKMVLICLLPEYLENNLINLKYPNHAISVRKRDIENMNIFKIEFPCSVREVKLTCSSLDFSKLKRLTLSQIADSNEFELDGLSSLDYLDVSLNSVERISLRNLPLLKHLVWSSSKLNKSTSTQLFENLPNITELELRGTFSDINLDDLVSLEKLKISGKIDDDFNFGLFKNISNHLQELLFEGFYDITYEQIAKLLYGYTFPYLYRFEIKRCDIKKLEKRMFEGFPMLKHLGITFNYELKQIENDTFSSLKNLTFLNLIKNSIGTLVKDQFSGLVNLEVLDLSYNSIRTIEENAFSNLKNLRVLDLSTNRLSKLNPNSFIGLENLRFIHLRDTSLESFDLNILINFVYIQEINLTRNQIINADAIKRIFKHSRIQFFF